MAATKHATFCRSGRLLPNSVQKQKPQLESNSAFATKRADKVRFVTIQKRTMIKTVEWTKDGVRMLDQRLLPTEEKYLTLRSYEEVADAIKKMVVRGAPAIGVSAAMGLALGAGQSVGTSVADLEYDFDFMCKVMEATRPTAVNLFWAIERMRGVIAKAKQENIRDDEDIKKLLP